MKNNQQEEALRVRRPRPGEVLGIVESLMGANRLKVRCQDNKIRLCRIPGKMRKRIWIREGDIVLIQPWEIQGDKSADILVKYRNNEAAWLRKKGFLTLQT